MVRSKDVKIYKFAFENSIYRKPIYHCFHRTRY
jgi:hypothetical protein